MRVFQELGRIVHERWRAANYAESCFADVALRALAEPSPIDGLTLDDVADELFSSDSLGPQRPFPFGEPPLVLFQTEAFYIEVLPWLDSTTAVHQHAFSGAFQVLEGSSLHTRFTFAPEQHHGDHLMLGQITPHRPELLKRGDARPIQSGMGFIHSLFHLDRPSVSVVVRTRNKGWSGPQYTYSRVTGVAYDPFHKPELLERRIQLMTTMTQLQSPRLGDWMAKVLGQCDAFSTFRMALAFATLGGALRDTLERLQTASGRHNTIVGLALEEAREQSRVSALVKLRRRIRSSAQRFFVALLLNVRGRQPILDLVREAYPQNDPVIVLCQWVRELASGLAFEKAPDLLDVHVDALFMPVCELMLRGYSGAVLLRELRSRHEVAGMDLSTAKVEALQDQMRRSQLFGWLLCEAKAEALCI